MKKVKWLFEQDTQDDLFNGLLYAADELGIEYKIIGIQPFRDKDTTHELYNFANENECVVVLGSIQMCHAIQRYMNWIPGTYCTFENYKCTSYYPKLSQFLLNENYIMLPFGELNRRKDFLFSAIGQDKCVFIRPDVGTKLFTGKLVKYEQYEADINMFGFYETKPNDLVVVASPRNIIQEWRLLVVDGKVVTGSLYRPEKKREMPQAVIEYGNTVAKEYQPDNCFVIDIGETSTGYYVIEIGSFSCAGMYCCDPTVVIKAVSEQALKDYEDFHS